MLKVTCLTPKRVRKTGATFVTISKEGLAQDRHGLSSLGHDTGRLACEGYERCLGLLSATTALTTSRQGLDPEVLTAALVGRYDEMLQRILGREARGEASDGFWWPEREDRSAQVSVLTYNSHEAILRCLLERGWDSNHRDYNGWSALHMTAFQGREAIIKLLLEKGADIEVCIKCEYFRCMSILFPRYLCK
jgi:hypothetical protein